MRHSCLFCLDNDSLLSGIEYKSNSGGDILAKQLNEMTKDELWSLFPIKISSYNPDWAIWYEEEEKRLEAVINPPNIVRINHIGSTAVFGMIAKPTIDILLEISTDTDTEELIRKLEYGGYLYSEQPGNPPPHMMFLKGYTVQGFEDRVFHLHIRYPGDWDELYFRDYLRRHKNIAGQYGKLKSQLAKQYLHDRDGYTEAKTEFISRYTTIAREELKGRYAYKQHI